MQLTKSATHTPGEANNSSASQILHVRYLIQATQLLSLLWKDLLHTMLLC